MCMVMNLELPMPTEDQQRMAIPILQKIICVKQVQEETTEELDAFMPSILSRAFSGAL
jgi:hypothetical protein